MRDHNRNITKRSLNICQDIMDPCRSMTLDHSETPFVYDDIAVDDSRTASPIKPTSTGNISQPTKPSTPMELSEHFYINNTKQKPPIHVVVKLNAEGIFFCHNNDNKNANVDGEEEDKEACEQCIPIEDIVGISCGPFLKRSHRSALASCRRRIDDEEAEAERVSEKEIMAYLHIYAYVKSDKDADADASTSAVVQRERTVRVLRFRSYDTYKENLKAAERWHHIIRLNQALVREHLVEKSMLIFLNPKSGSGRGREMFHKQVAPVLKEANIPYELHVTAYYNYAREYVRKHNDLLSCYGSIVVASGDGLFYEVLNGIMEREDWRVITRRLPIGIIPCGSGNGLARSIAYLYNESYEPKPILYATLTCITGKVAPMDVVRVDTGKAGESSEMYSFLSVGWGLIADVDIESEALRSIGASRFTFWTIRRLIALRTYHGKLSYIRCDLRKDGHKHFGNRLSTTSHEVGRLPPEVQQFHDIHAPLAEAQDGDFRAARSSISEDDFEDAISVNRSSFPSQTDSWHSAVSKRTSYLSIAEQSIRSSRRSLQSRLQSINLEYESQRPPTTIPPLDQPLPTDGTWHTEEGDYIMVHAAYTTHLSTDCFFAPDSRLSDGIIYLVIVRAGCSRSQLLNFALSLSSGTHLPKEPNCYIEVVPVSAFRIEPNTVREGIITVDGERVDYGPIQGEVLQGLINVMVPNGKAIN